MSCEALLFDLIKGVNKSPLFKSSSFCRGRCFAQNSIDSLFGVNRRQDLNRALGSRSFACAHQNILQRKEDDMLKGKGVSGNTHTKQQLDDYANQRNPNNKAFKANAANQASQKAKKKRGKEWDIGFLEGESYSRFDENWLN